MSFEYWEQLLSNLVDIFQIVESFFMFVLTALAVLYAKKSWKEQVRLEGEVVARDMALIDIDWNTEFVPVYITIANIGEKAIKNVKVYVDNSLYKVIPFILANEKLDFLIAKYSTIGHMTCWLDGVRMPPRDGDSADLRLPKIEVKTNSIYLSR